MEPQLLFDRFLEICQIPRESGNELGMERYLEAFAASHGFSANSDATGNLVIYVPARGKGAGLPPIVLQSHTDMVCVKETGSEHDFTKDPIRTHVEMREEHGEMQPVLMADNTTLGADNGIGVAAALAAATDLAITDCPPLELLFTVDEERGLTGASTLDPALLTGRLMINMDSEELGDICISCAGGRDMTAVWTFERTGETHRRVPLFASLTGLPGGHSGVQIDEGRGNAISMLATALFQSVGLDYSALASIAGGSKRNVIPSSAEIIVWLDPDIAENVMSIFEHPDMLHITTQDMRVGTDRVSLTATLMDDSATPAPLSDEITEMFFDAITAIPWGPQKMSELVHGLVETSNNVAVISTTEHDITLTCSTRSSKSGAIAEFQTAQAAALEESGATVTFSDGYPGWEADPENPLLKQAEKTFTRVLGKAPKITAVHAGLECGVIKGIIPDMRMISFGPDILDAHTILERVLLNSVPPFYACVTALLQDLCN